VEKSIAVEHYTYGMISMIIYNAIASKSILCKAERKNTHIIVSMSHERKAESKILVALFDLREGASFHYLANENPL
jgi:hypothetical protein